MKKLDINNTRKQYNIMLNAYTKAEETRFNVHCFHIHLVATNELTSKEFEEHITDAISGMNDLPKDNTLLQSKLKTELCVLCNNLQIQGSQLRNSHYFQNRGTLFHLSFLPVALVYRDS